MIIVKAGQSVTCGSRKYHIGMPVKATIGSDYAGVYGTIACIKTGKDKDGAGSEPELYVDFHFPYRPDAREKLIKRFGALFVEQATDLREWVRMKATHLIPTACFVQFLRHRDNGKQYLLYRNSQCTEIVTDTTYHWPYADLSLLMEPVVISEADVPAFLARLRSKKDFLYDELACQLEDAWWRLQHTDSRFQAA